MREAQNYFLPSPGARRGGDLNCKFKTFGFLDTLKVHIQSNYITSTTAKISDYQMPND